MSRRAGCDQPGPQGRGGRARPRLPARPGSVAISSIGGNVATVAGGLCCVKYDVTRDYVRRLTVVLADGTLARLGTSTAKGVAGLDLRGLFIGSEGTLGVVVEITVRLVPLLPTPLTAVATSRTSAGRPRPWRGSWPGVPVGQVRVAGPDESAAAPRGQACTGPAGHPQPRQDVCRAVSRQAPRPAAVRAARRAGEGQLAAGDRHVVEHWTRCGRVPDGQRGLTMTRHGFSPHSWSSSSSGWKPRCS